MQKLLLLEKFYDYYLFLHVEKLRESFYMEEKIRAKAINAKFDKDIKAAAVRYEAQISVLNA